MPPVYVLVVPVPTLPSGGESVMSNEWAIVLGAFAIISLILIGIMLDDSYKWDWKAKKKDKERRKERRKKE